jgi:hypothetical protein
VPAPTPDPLAPAAPAPSLDDALVALPFAAPEAAFAPGSSSEHPSDITSALAAANPMPRADHSVAMLRRLAIGEPHSSARRVE